MGSLVPLFLAVALLAAAQMGFGAGAPELPWMIAPLATWPMFAAHMTRRAVRGGKMAAVRRWIVVTEASGAAAYFVLLFGCAWLDTVRRWTGDPLLPESWPDWALGVALAPFVVFQLLAIDASARAHGGTRETQRHMRDYQARMFLAVLAPIGLFIGASSLIAAFPWMRAQVEHVGLVWTLFMVLFVGLMALSFPRVIRWAWDTEAFPDGPQRELLDGVAQKAEFKPADLRVWKTGNLVANATIVGLSRRGRVVLFSDELLSILNSRELSAVYAHEIGHAVRGHVGVFLAWTAGFFLLGDFAVASILDAGSTTWAVVAGLGLAVLWWITFGWLSRRFELEADLFSFEVVRDLPALVSALERVGGPDRTRNGWRHFSVQRRVRFLARVAADERFVRGFRGRLKAMAGVGFTLAMAGAVVQVASLVQDLPRDRTVAALAVGNYAAAGQHLEGVDETDAETAEDLATLLEAGRSTEAFDSTEDALRAALERGGATADDLEALALVAALQGVPHASRVAEAMDHAVERDLEAADEAAQEVGGRLREPLEGWLSRARGE